MKRVVSVIAAVVGVALVAFGVVDANNSTAGADARSALSLIAPADAGGGWDSTAREAQQALRGESIVNNPQVVNVPGAGGTIGLSQLSPWPTPPTSGEPTRTASRAAAAPWAASTR